MGKRKPPLTKSVRDGLRTVWAFCDANNYEDSELLQSMTERERRNTQAALDWIERVSSSDTGVNR